MHQQNLRLKLIRRAFADHVQFRSIFWIKTEISFPLLPQI